MIKMDNVTFGYDKKLKVLEHFNLDIKENECAAIIGENGAGKSTILQLIVGLFNSFEGSIIAAGIDVKNKKTLNELRKKVGFVFQDSESQLFMNNVYEDISFGPKNYRIDNVEKRVYDVLKYLEIEHIKDKPIFNLSGGEKKLVSLATVLVMEPEILLFDEPTIALDPKHRRIILSQIKKTRGTKVIATHDLDMVYEICDRVILINKGRVIVDGIPEDILTNKNLLEKYGLELPLCMQKIVK